MSASADKVQFILESLLEESLPLLKKGIFTQLEMRDMMAQREKCENAMLRNQFKLTDYLKSIEYEYELERQRRSRIDECAKTGQVTSNPLFRKQSKTDFVIVKRIIKLWDRTLHKFKYRVYLWKQYMNFCIAIGSKKTFYKALTNALRFLPFQVDLWRIGAAYEVEIGHNFWKGRKIFMKGLNMIPAGMKNVSLCEQMIRFELEFMRIILQRKRIMLKGQQKGITFVGEEQISEQDQLEEKIVEEENINIEEYDGVIWLIVEETLTKNINPQVQALKDRKLVERLLILFCQLINQETQAQIKYVLRKVTNKLEQHYAISNPVPKEEQQLQIEIDQEEVKDNQRKGEVKKQQQIMKFQFLSDYEKVNIWKEKIVEKSEQSYKINWKTAELAIKQFCLKPARLKQIYQFLLEVDLRQSINFILSARQSTKIPNQVLSDLLTKTNNQRQMESLSQDEALKLLSFLINQVDKKLNVNDFKTNMELFKSVVNFNRNQNRFDKNTAILRSISIQFKQQGEFVERCSRLINTL